MNYESTVTCQSKTFPGVTFVVRRFTAGMRARLRQSLANVLRIHRENARKRETWLNQICDEKGIDRADRGSVQIEHLGEDRQAQFEELLAQDDLLTDTEWKPRHFDAGFVSIDGITIDGQQPNGQLLRDSGPQALYAEILDEIYRQIGLSGAEAENLGSPTTSGAGVDGKVSATTAPPASETGSTAPETAGSITPTT